MLSFVDERGAADRLAVDAYDLQGELLGWALDGARDTAAMAFVFARGGDAIARTVDYDDGIASYRLRRPASSLPSALAGEGTVDVVAARAGADARDLYALWTAGLVSLPDEVVEGPMARPLVDEASDVQVDRDAALRVAGALVRMRGRTFYDVLDVAADADARLIEEKLATLGPAALAHKHLGPARQAARELWALLADARATLTHETARALYDVTLGAARPPSAPAGASVSPEQSFLDGQLALDAGDPVRARESFEEATRARPNDPDYNAWLAWASILSGEDERFALDILDTAARAYPEAMRPVFFLGLAARRRGDVEKARAHLAEAVARAPADVGARRALQELEELEERARLDGRG